jgi:hypothetical protein
MAIPGDYRSEIQFDSAFSRSLVLIGDGVPDNGCQTRDNKAVGGGKSVEQLGKAA